MKCPVCSDSTLQMAERKGMEIDYCPDCRGVWLDRGELDKLIDKRSAPGSERSDVGRAHPGLDAPRGHRYPPPYQKRRSSWLSEIFD